MAHPPGTPVSVPAFSRNASYMTGMRNSLPVRRPAFPGKMESVESEFKPEIMFSLCLCAFPRLRDKNGSVQRYSNVSELFEKLIEIVFNDTPKCRSVGSEKSEKSGKMKKALFGDTPTTRSVGARKARKVESEKS